jgi:hypothetical protein
MFGLIYSRWFVQMLKRLVHLLNDELCFTKIPFNFLYHIPNLIHRCMAIYFRKKNLARKCDDFVLMYFMLSLCRCGNCEIVRCRMSSQLSFGAFAIFDGIFALIIKPLFTWVLWYWRGLWNIVISY